MGRRENELTEVVHRDVFDRLPADAGGDEAVRRWVAFRRAYHAAAGLEGVAAFPLQLDFELSTGCQMRCTFCQQRHRLSEARVMPWDVYQRAIDEGERYGLVSVKLNANNEPLLRPDLTRFIRYAKDHGVLNTYLATNGLWLDEPCARRLIRAGLTKVMVSLDATTADTYRAVRGSRHFEYVRGNVLRLLALREILGSALPYVRVNFLRTDLNAHEADAFREEWEPLVDSIGFQEQLGIPGVENNGHGLVGARCAMPFKLVTVSVDGDLWPCCTFSGACLSLGNLAQTTIKGAWDSAAAAALRGLQRSGAALDHPVCRHCLGG